MSTGQCDLFRDGFVVRANRAKKCNEERDEDDHDPRAMGEFRAGNNQCGDGGGHGADAVDQQFLFPMRSLLDEPALDHSGLGDRKREEHADGIEGNQRMGVAVE